MDVMYAICFELRVQLLWIIGIYRIVANPRRTTHWWNHKTVRFAVAYFPKWSHEGEHLAGAMMNVACPNMQF